MKKIKILIGLLCLNSCKQYIYNSSQDSLLENPFILTKKGSTLIWTPYPFLEKGGYTIFVTDAQITHTFVQLSSTITTYELEEIYMIIYEKYELFVSACTFSEDDTYQIVASTNSILI